MIDTRSIDILSYNSIYDKPYSIWTYSKEIFFYLHNLKHMVYRYGISNQIM